MFAPELDQFLSKQRILIIATVNPDGHPWITNLYFVSTQEGAIYFVSSTDSAHHFHLKEKNQIAWSVVWADPEDMANRKGVQAVGSCTEVTSLPEIIKVAKLISQKFVDWDINLKALQNLSGKSRVYKITTSDLKYWDDEVFGDKHFMEYTFPENN